MSRYYTDPFSALINPNELAALLKQVRLETLEKVYRTICTACMEGVPMKDDKWHVGERHCYAWAIRALEGSRDEHS